MSKQQNNSENTLKDYTLRGEEGFTELDNVVEEWDRKVKQILAPKTEKEKLRRQEEEKLEKEVERIMKEISSKELSIIDLNYKDK